MATNARGELVHPDTGQRLITAILAIWCATVSGAVAPA